jgi:hypothetical protein
LPQGARQASDTLPARGSCRRYDRGG